MPYDRGVDFRTISCAGKWELTSAASVFTYSMFARTRSISTPVPIVKAADKNLSRRPRQQLSLQIKHMCIVQIQLTQCVRKL